MYESVTWAALARSFCPQPSPARRDRTKAEKFKVRAFRLTNYIYICRSNQALPLCLLTASGKSA
jgi:hypothetical protein